MAPRVLLIPSLVVVVLAVAISVALATPIRVVDGPRGSDPECPASAQQQLCNGEMCAAVCPAGTVQLDAWADKALAFQRLLQINESVLFAQLVGTHNSFISQANGIGVEADFLSDLLASTYPNNNTVTIANQRYSLTDQLRMGVRHLELDIHWVNDRVTLCHWDEAPSDFVNLVSQVANSTGRGPLQWSPQRLGCDASSSVPLDNALAEIRQWVDQQPRQRPELLVLYLDNRVPVEHVDAVVQVVQKYFGDLLYTPAMKHKQFGYDQWPTVAQLAAVGKTVMVKNGDYDKYQGKASDLFFTSPDDGMWVEFNPTGFRAYPRCTMPDGMRYTTSNLTRILDHSLVLGPQSDERVYGMVRPQDIADMAACGVSFVSLDQTRPSEMANFVWSWVPGEPQSQLSKPGATASPKCVIQRAIDGRWTLDDCSNPHMFACQADGHPEAWLIGTNKAPFPTGNASNSLCPSGYHFSVPSNGYFNSELATALQCQGNSVWLNIPPELVRSHFAA